MLGHLQRIDREFDVDVSLQLAVTAGIDKLLGRLRNDGIAVVIQPIDQRRIVTYSWSSKAVV